MKNFKKGVVLRSSKGFTLIELLVVIAIIGILATIVMAVLSNSKNKGKDAKIRSQLGQMSSQALLFSGTMVAPSPTVIPAYQMNGTITGQAAGGTAGTGTLFNDTNTASNSLYPLASKLPNGTYVYYGWDGVNPTLTGRWFFAASLSTGAFCRDHRNEKKEFIGTPPTTSANFVTAFPNATAAGGYLCN